MSLLARTFSILRFYWKQLVTASVSAAISAVFSGLLIWMAGPLLMTLFQVEQIPGLDQSTVEIHQPAAADSLDRNPANARPLKDLSPGSPAGLRI